MKFLLVAKQKKNVDAFRTTIARLLQGGHEITLAIEERDEERDRALLAEFASALLTLRTPPLTRSDSWRISAPLLRRVRDWTQYLGPEYAGADRLRQRVVDKLRVALAAHGSSMGDGLVPGFGPEQVTRITDLLASIEANIPSDRLYEEFVSQGRPDAVLVTPGVHFGSAQADFIKSARAAGIPVWMLLFSWDNLSTKGALHVAPDRMFVWNERQRAEATALHDFPAERVTVVGAPRFDEFFALRPALARARFFAPLGLDPGRPTLMYVCSSRFVASRELSFVRQWLSALRGGTGDDAVRGCNVIVRPHPDIALVEDDAPEMVRWPEIPLATGYVSRPFGDDRAVLLRTSNATPQTFFECLDHSAAIVGLNTSAELEAAIAGRPVFTVVADDRAVEGQTSTLHFHYLLRENGGFVVSAPDLATHRAQLSQALAQPPGAEAIRAFAHEFLRPRGDRPVAAVLARALEKAVNREAAGSDTAAPQSSRDAGPDASAAAAGPVLQNEEPDTLGVEYPGSRLRMRAAVEIRRSRRRSAVVPEEETVRWLEEHVAPGDVVYDIGAGAGLYSLIAATHRGALTVAIEPGFVAYKELCDNILLNDCSRSVIPLPVALGARTGLAELEYPSEKPGGSSHTLNARPWRQRTDSRTLHYVQPVCVEALDALIDRHRLPRPQHVRLSVSRDAAHVLAGAAGVLRRDVKSLLLVARSGELASRSKVSLSAHGMSVVAERSIEKGAQVLVFAADRASRPWYWPWNGARSGSRIKAQS